VGISLAFDLHLCCSCISPPSKKASGLPNLRALATHPGQRRGIPESHRLGRNANIGSDIETFPTHCHPQSLHIHLLALNLHRQLVQTRLYTLLMLDRWLALGRQPTSPTQFQHPEQYQGPAIARRNPEQESVSIVNVYSIPQNALLIPPTVIRSV
jgi:hypothetical protein